MADVLELWAGPMAETGLLGGGEMPPPPAVTQEVLGAMADSPAVMGLVKGFGRLLLPPELLHRFVKKVIRRGEVSSMPGGVIHCAPDDECRTTMRVTMFFSGPVCRSPFAVP